MLLYKNLHLGAEFVCRSFAFRDTIPNVLFNFKYRAHYVMNLLIYSIQYIQCINDGIYLPHPSTYGVFDDSTIILLFLGDTDANSTIWATSVLYTCWLIASGPQRKKPTLFCGVINLQDYLELSVGTTGWQWALTVSYCSQGKGLGGRTAEIRYHMCSTAWTMLSNTWTRTVAISLYMYIRSNQDVHRPPWTENHTRLSHIIWYHLR